MRVLGKTWKNWRETGERNWREGERVREKKKGRKKEIVLKGRKERRKESRERREK